MPLVSSLRKPAEVAISCQRTSTLDGHLGFGGGQSRRIAAQTWTKCKCNPQPSLIAGSESETDLSQIETDGWALGHTEARECLGNSPATDKLFFVHI